MHEKSSQPSSMQNIAFMLLPSMIAQMLNIGSEVLKLLWMQAQPPCPFAHNLPALLLPALT
jgi:hypothetical protein